MLHVHSQQDVKGSELEGVHVQGKSELYEAKMQLESHITSHFKVQLWVSSNHSERINDVQVKGRGPCQGELNSGFFARTDISVLVDLTGSVVPACATEICPNSASMPLFLNGLPFFFLIKLAVLICCVVNMNRLQIECFDQPVSHLF